MHALKDYIALFTSIRTITHMIVNMIVPPLIAASGFLGGEGWGGGGGGEGEKMDQNISSRISH